MNLNLDLMLGADDAQPANGPGPGVDAYRDAVAAAGGLYLDAAEATYYSNQAGTTEVTADDSVAVRIEGPVMPPDVVAWRATSAATGIHIRLRTHADYLIRGKPVMNVPVGASNTRLYQSWDGSAAIARPLVEAGKWFVAALYRIRGGTNTGDGPTDRGFMMSSGSTSEHNMALTFQTTAEAGKGDAVLAIGDGLATDNQTVRKRYDHGEVGRLIAFYDGSTLRWKFDADAEEEDADPPLFGGDGTLDNRVFQTPTNWDVDFAILSAGRDFGADSEAHWQKMLAWSAAIGAEL